MRLLPVAVVVTALALAACGSDDNTSGSSSSARETIEVHLSEFKLDPSRVTVDTPGTYTFKAVNDGQFVHALEIEGHGIEQKTATIDPGKTATLRVDLAKTGSYEVYCPIDDHRNMGMKASLAVGGAAAPAVGGTSTEGTTTGQTTTTKGGYGY
jgi:uncharacterized cupredoxin-like copper-binding protein